MTRNPITLLSVIVLCGSLLSGCAATPWPPAAIQTRCPPGFVGKSVARASPSGEFCLEIVPDDDLRAGMHGAHYHMTRNGKAVWSGQRDYTLRNPIVTNDGTVVGVAYRSEIKKEDTPRREKSYMHIVAIRDGQDIQDWVQEQGLPSYNLSYTDRPYAKNLVVDPANDRFIVNLVEHGTSQRGHPACWLFRLSDCTFISADRLPTNPGHARPGGVRQGRGLWRGFRVHHGNSRWSRARRSFSRTSDCPARPTPAEGRRRNMTRCSSW